MQLGNQIDDKDNHNERHLDFCYFILTHDMNGDNDNRHEDKS